MAEEFKISLGIKLNESDFNNIQSQIKGLEKDGIKIKFDVGNVKNDISSVTKQIQQNSNNVLNTGAIRKYKQEMSDFVRLQNQINQKKIDIGKLEAIGGKTNQITELKRQLKELENTYDNLMNTFSKKLFANANNVSLNDVSNFNDKIIAATEQTENKLRELDAKVADTKAKLASDIKINIQNGSLEAELSDTTIKLDKLEIKSKGLKSAIVELTTARQNLKNAMATDNTDDIVQYNIAYQNALEKVNNQLIINTNNQRRLKEAQNQNISLQNLANDKKAFSSSIDVWLKNNSAATKDFGDAILKIRNQIKSADATKLKSLKAEFKEVTQQAKLAGVATKNYADKLKEQFSKYGIYLSAATMISYTTRALRSMFNEVVEIDKAMTELKKVTNETDEAYERFLSNASNKAKEIGTTIDGIVSSTADFARLGYSLGDASYLAEVANIYAVVGDEVDSVETATKSVISTLTAFKIEASDAISVVDKLNEVGNNFAISSGGIGDALQRSASSMAAANNTLDQTIALITAANTVVQDPTSVGTAFKTISMRIRGAKTDLEEAGLETDGMAESTAKLRDEIMALSGVDIMLDDNTFKSTYQIMDELSKKWEYLTDIQQASITELIAGKRQGNIVSSLMENFDIAREALETSLDSEGSAMEEHTKWMESLEAKLLKLQAAWQSLAQNFLSSEFLGIVIETVIKLVEALDWLVEHFGAIGTVLSGVVIVNVLSTIKAFGGLSAVVTDVKSLSDAVTLLGMKANGTYNIFGKLISLMLKHPYIALASVIGGALVFAFNKWYVSAKEANEAMEEAFNEYEDAKQKTSELNSELETTQKRIRELESKDGLTFIEESELDKLKEATELLLVQADLAEKEENRKAVEAGDAAVKAYKKNFKKDISKELTDYYDNPELLGGINFFNDESDISAMIAGIRHFKRERDLLDKENENYGHFYEDFSETIDDATASVEEQLQVLAGYEAKLEAIPEDLREQSHKDALQSIKDAREYIYSELDPDKWKQIQFDKLFVNDEELAKAKQELVYLASKYNALGVSVEDVTSKYPNLANAVEDVNSLVDNINSEAGIINIDKLKENLNIDNIVDEDFNNKVDAYVDNMTTLQQALKSFEEGDFFNDDLEKLKEDFPTLTDEMSNFEESVNNLMNDLSNDMLDDFSDQFNQLDTDEDIEALESFQDAVLDLGDTVGNTYMSIDIDAEAEEMDKLKDAMEESVSATGLTSESIATLKSRYKELEKEGYNLNELFEETTNGIHLNGKALRKLEAEYQKQKKASIDKDLETYQVAYDKLTDRINECTDASERAQLYSQRDTIINRINDTAMLAAQYEGLTSAYHKWQMAQDSGNERDMYEGFIEGKAELDEEMSRGWLDDDARAYLELLSGKDLSTAKFDELLAVYKELGEKTRGGYSVYDFFTEDDDGNSTATGIFNFFDAVKAKQQELGKELVKITEDGHYVFDFGVDGDKAVAEALGISEEMVQIILRAAADAGFEVNLDSAYTELADFSDKVQELNNKLKEVKATEYTFNINSGNIEDVNTQINEALITVQKIKNEDGTFNFGLNQEDYDNTMSLLATLIFRKSDLEAPVLMSVEINTEEPMSEIEDAISVLQEYRDAVANLEFQTAIGADTTDAQNKIKTVSERIKEIPPEIKTELGLDTKAFDYAISSITSTEINVEAGVNLSDKSISTINSKLAEITPQMMVDAGLDASKIDGYTPEDKEATVKYNVDSEEVDKYNPKDLTRTVTYKRDSYTVDTYNPSNLYRTVTYTIQTVGSVGVDGTAHVQGAAFANGTTGKAFKMGDWGTKDSGVALGGELGAETIVRDGKFFTIGDNGAEFFHYKKGDIIFNHKQTEELFKNGKVTSGGGRGKALANGTAFASGTAFSDGSGGGRVTISGSVVKTHSGKKGSKKSSDDFEETFDWVETAIDRIERAISKLDLTANNVYKTWSKRNKALKNEITKVGEEIGIQESAYERYMQEADNVGLSESWAKLVRDGAIDISTVTDEDLADKISSYKEWYEKALDCEEAIEELKEQEAELYKQRFDNIATQYDGILSTIEHEKNMLEEYISQSEAKGHIISTKYYEALIDNEKDNIAKLKEEKQELLSSLEEAVNSGTIEKGSEAWYEMCNEIDEVTLAIEKGNTAILEYGNSIREIEWEIFDLAQQKISNLTTEANFLIDLMSNDKLYDDRGQLTNEGKATMGLHGQNYNVYMAQAEMYAQEMLDIEKELAENPYDQKLIERKQELLELQQDSILAAEDEKQAIVDMVREGIELELDALQELIDTYNEALDSRKDLYDYQKKVAEQTKEIAKLEKQMSAYAGDTSEETKAKIQELKVSLEKAKLSLEETEYEKYISDQKILLDDLYLEYETVLNQRLDDIDGLISDMISEINTDAAMINDTIGEKAELVGYTISEEMKSIWNTGSDNMKNVLTTYGEGIQNSILSAGTTLASAIATMNTNISSMIAQLNAAAESNTNTAQTSSVASSYTNTSSSSGSSNKSTSSSSSSSSKSSSSSSTSSSSNKSSSSTGNITVGSKINASGAKIYDYAGDTSGESQYFKNNPTYTVLAVKDGYVQVRHSSLSSGITGWFKMSDVKAYKTGKQNFLADEIAWTQDGGREFIVRPSDGAILTPLAKGDSVLNATASNNIWDMANNPSDFVRDNLKLNEVDTSISKNNQTSYTQYLDNVVFSLPNVKNYNELLSEMQRDKNFEKLISAMTIDRLAGKSALGKGKAIR